MPNIIQTNFQYAKPLIPLDLDNVNYIIIHHADAVTASPEDIHEWHLEAGKELGNPMYGCIGFGYNEYIRKDGTVYIGRGDHIGSQCANMNSKSYGICCEGNYDTEMDMPEVQKQSLVTRIKYNIPRFHNYIATMPHNHFCDTSCPGIHFPMVEILGRLEVKNMTVNEAIEKLVAAGVISSPAYWLMAIQTTMHLDQLLINMAQKLA